MLRWPMSRIGWGRHVERTCCPALPLLPLRPALLSSLVNRRLCRASPPYNPIFQGKTCLYLAIVKTQVARRTSPTRLVGGPHLQRLPPRPGDGIVPFCSSPITSCRVELSGGSAKGVRSAPSIISRGRYYLNGGVVVELCDDALGTLGVTLGGIVFNQRSRLVCNLFDVPGDLVFFCFLLQPPFPSGPVFEDGDDGFVLVAFVSFRAVGC